MIEMIERSYVLDDATVTGREVLLRAVPFGQVAVVRDRVPGGGFGPAYREMIERGAFRNVAKAAHRIPLIAGTHEDRHTRNLLADIGKGTSFEERPDALYTAFAIDQDAVGDHALTKIADGQWKGVSIGAQNLRKRIDGDVTVRTLVHLDHVLLTESPQYRGAEVVEVRDDPESRLQRWIRKYPLRSH